MQTHEHLHILWGQLGELEYRLVIRWYQGIINFVRCDNDIVDKKMASYFRDACYNIYGYNVMMSVIHFKIVL